MARRAAPSAGPQLDRRIRGQTTSIALAAPASCPASRQLWARKYEIKVGRLSQLGERGRNILVTWKSNRILLSIGKEQL